MIIPTLDPHNIGAAYSDVINPLIKNYTNETFSYQVKKRDGSILDGILGPSGYVNIPNLRVGDAIRLWNKEHIAHQEFTQPRNSKYILAHHRNRRDILFKNRGYHPIILDRVREPRVVVVTPVPQQSTHTGQPSMYTGQSNDSKIYIMLFVVIVLLAAGLATSLVFASSRNLGGGLEHVQDSHSVPSIYI